MNTKNIRDIVERKQVWNIGFPDTEAPISSKILFELADRIPLRLFICEENHYLLDLLPAFGFLMIRFIMRVGSDSMKVLFNPAGNDFEFSHSVH